MPLLKRQVRTKSPGLSRWTDGAWQIMSLPLLLFIALPLLALLFQVTPTELIGSLKQPVVQEAVQLSLWTSLTSTLLTLLLGTPVAYLLARPGFPLRQWLDSLVDLPTVLPPAVAGVALLMAFGRRGLIGSWLAPLRITIPFTPIAVVMAQTFVAAPLYIKAAAIGFTAIGAELKQAAALDGASNWQVFRYIILPLSFLPMITGSAMTWARSLGEFGATIIFAGNLPGRTQTMPLAIYIGFEINLDVALALSFILIAFSFLILLMIKAILRQQLGSDLEERMR